MADLTFDSKPVQTLRRLLSRRSDRHGEGRFVVEGAVLTAEAVRAGWNCIGQYVPGASAVHVEGAGPVNALAPGVFERVATTQTPQPPLALFEMRVADVTETLAAASFLVVLDRIGDPGNLGTILRSAEAAGVDAVVLTPGSVDAFNPKVVRSSAGALFHVAVVIATIEEVRNAGFRLFGTTSHAAVGRSVTDHTEADLTGRMAIVMGNEAAGLPDHWNDETGPISAWLTIRHQGRSESLNVAMAATVIAFEAARQRRSATA